MSDKKKVLIINHGTKYMDDLKGLYDNYRSSSQNTANGKDNNPKEKKAHQVDVKEHHQVSQLKPEQLKEYDIIQFSGSYRNHLDTETAQHLIQNARDDTYIIGMCYGAQVLAKYHGVEELHRLKEHQKGKKEITHHTKGEKTRYIHKAHSYGIPITEKSQSKLELEASSEQTFEDGNKGNIYEIFRANEGKHIGIQGHPEQGTGKEIMYEILNEIHGQGQNQAYNHSHKKKYKN